MSQLYDIYQSDTFHLARSIVIKLDLVSEAINKELSFSGYPVAPDSPASYKYYLNLSGEYHTSDHDLLMRQYGSHHIMVDIATNTGYEPVPFVRELFHGPTANSSLLNEYQLGSNFYNRLVVKYPQFETLIKGILSPIDINDAINAPNGAILSIAYRHRKTRDNGDAYYEVPVSLKGTKTSKLIESQEHNLITELQSWVSKSLFRWVIPGYSLTDDLYVPFVVGILSAMLPSKIMNLRWGNVHTSYAHTFHIKEYLNSHGMLGKYVQFIPLEQILYLYRNVRYLEINLGKTSTFHDIVDNMLTPTRVPMAGYYFKHDIAKMYGSQGSLLPEGRMMREHINYKSLGAGSDRRDIRELLDRQVPLARENHRHLDNVEYETRQAIKWSGDDSLIVKVLESELTDIVDPIPVTLLSQLTWFWAYLSSQGMYTGNIFVSNPVSGERISLTPLNAFILMIYCANVAGRNNHLEYIPNDIVTAHWITKSSNVDLVPPEGGYHVKPSLDVMRAQTEEAHITDDTINLIMGDFEGDYYASGPADFLDKIKRHHENLSRMFFTICRIENSIGHGYGEHVWFNMFWHDIPVRLTEEPVRYDEWLPRLGVNFDYFTLSDYDKLSVELITECTGLNGIVDINRVELQRSMIEILKHFGSYTTHYLQSANQGTVTTSTGKYIRVQELQVFGDAYLEEGIYIGLDMFNDKVEADLIQTVGMGVMDVVDLGLDNATMDISINPSLNIEAGEMVFNNMVPMAHIEVLRGELSYDTTPIVKIPSPPTWTTLYDVRQYLSTPYFLFDNQSATGTMLAITADINDFPDVVDNIISTGLTAVSGNIEQVTTSVEITVSDTLNVSGLTAIEGTSEYVTTNPVIPAYDEVYIGLVNHVYVNLIAPNLNRFADSMDTSIETITGVVEDAVVVDVIDSGSLEFITIDGIGLDASNLSDAIDVNDISITSNIVDEPELIEDAIIILDGITGTGYDEPDLIEDAAITLDDLSGDVVDDRTSESSSSVSLEMVSISGEFAEAEAYFGGISSASGTLESITGDINIPIDIITTDSTSAQVMKITGKSTDAKLPRKTRDVMKVNIVDVSGTSYDQPTTKAEGNIEVDLLGISVFIGDDYFFTMVDATVFAVDAITGSVYDEVVRDYSNHLSFNVMSVEATTYDDYLPPDPLLADITIVSVDGKVTDIQTVAVDDATRVDVTNITGDTTDRRVESIEDVLNTSVDAIVMRVTDDIVLLETTPVSVTDILVAGHANDQTSRFVDGAKAVGVLSDIVGEVYDESTIDVTNPLETSVSKITGRARDDRNNYTEDSYWHRVAKVTGRVFDSRTSDCSDSTTLDIVGITGSCVDGDVSITSNVGVTETSVSGSVYDSVLNHYGLSTDVNVISINGNMVDDNALFNRMSNTVEVTDIDGKAYDEITTSYVDNNVTITPVITSGTVWDILPDTFVLNNSVTIISINGEITDEDE